MFSAALFDGTHRLTCWGIMRPAYGTLHVLRDSHIDKRGGKVICKKNSSRQASATKYLALASTTVQGQANSELIKEKQDVITL